MEWPRSLVTDTKVATILKVSDYFQETKIPIGSIIVCATDGTDTGR